MGKRLTKDAARAQRQKIAAMLNTGMSINGVARELGINASTVFKVKTRMEDPERSVDEDLRSGNKGVERWREEDRDIILKLRKETNMSARLIWAVIQRDPERYGLNPDLVPSVRKIGEWLAENKMLGKAIGPADNRSWPVEWGDTPGIIAIDGTGPYYNGSDRIYLTTVQDYNTRLSLGIPTTSKTESASINTWTHAIHMAKKHLLPDNALTHIFSDNGEMGIANGWTKNSVRHVLKLGAIMVFNAPGKPWKSGRLENWHGRLVKNEFVYPMEREQRERRKAGLARISTKEWIGAWLAKCNFYNVDRPHSELKTHAPADLAPYMPVTNDILSIPRYEELAPQAGIVDVIRLVWNTGEIELWGTDRTYIQKIFGGQYVRIRFFCDPTAEEQNGQVLWQRGRHKEALVIATFNHKMDRHRKRGEEFIYNLRFVDYEDIEAEDERNIDITTGEIVNTPPPDLLISDLTRNDLMKIKQSAKKHVSSENDASATKTNPTTIMRLLDRTASSLIDLYQNSDLEEDELRTLIEQMSEQIFYQARR